MQFKTLSYVSACCLLAACGGGGTSSSGGENPTQDAPGASVFENVTDVADIELTGARLTGGAFVIDDTNGTGTLLIQGHYTAD